MFRFFFGFPLGFLGFCGILKGIGEARKRPEQACNFVHDFEHGFGREAADPGDNPHSGVYAGTCPGRLLVASGANTLILGYTPGVRRVTPGCPPARQDSAETKENQWKFETKSEQI